jgi:hypothetical protein
MTIQKITKTEMIADLDAALDRAADEARHWLMTESGLDEIDQLLGLQQAYTELRKAREIALERIEAIWRRVDAAPNPTGILH